MKIDVLESSIADHQPLPDKIANFIREAIIVGKLKPGEKISEAKLAEELCISRTPIREAIRMLESEGFVSIIPRRGTVVSEFTFEDLFECFQIKACLEAFSAFLAEPEMTERDINRLRRLNEEEKAAIANQDFVKFMRIHEEFHLTFLNKSGNVKLNKLNSQMMTHIKRLQGFFIQQPEIFSHCANTHVQIIDAFSRHDGQRVRQLVEDNILHIAAQVRQHHNGTKEHG
ncbi:MAG: GntR family transcriptional regulator [Deltaproteobacteria bacterium]|nr:GntR family transcriptional regulator [Candidatus Anaeroferrophillus wilburensis]MBN2889512.1 GntR family transcriptional regulator [Deltaproteobacteria bacterium]